jgi:hypothetical protein
MLSTLGGCLLCASFLCFLIGGVLFLTRGARPVASAGRRPRTAVPPRRAASASRTPPPIAQRTGNTMRDRFANARIGQTLVVNHPQRGPLTGRLLGSIRYTELWQQGGTGPNVPWTPTGNEFIAHWLGNFMVYEWQDRLYLLDEYEPLTDQDIQQSFLPYAKQFAQSNQTAKVTFAWPPASWTMVDIGKFRVARAEGDGLRLSQGAEGRFIHAAGSDNRALVVEDYQGGGGGKDTAWSGWQIAWEDIRKIG